MSRSPKKDDKYTTNLKNGSKVVCVEAGIGYKWGYVSTELLCYPREKATRLLHAVHLRSTRLTSGHPVTSCSQEIEGINPLFYENCVTFKHYDHHRVQCLHESVIE